MADENKKKGDGPDYFSTAISGIFANHNRNTQRTTPWLKANSTVKARDIELATAVLLVELASCDENFEPREFQTIVGGIQRIFGTKADEIRKLIHEAKLAIANMRGTDKFAELLRDNLQAEQKKLIFDVIDEVIRSDGIEDDYEVFLRNKFTRLIEGDVQNIKLGKRDDD
jgi:uncharacterized tellurite resistance protein B-like protein